MKIDERYIEFIEGAVELKQTIKDFSEFKINPIKKLSKILFGSSNILETSKILTNALDGDDKYKTMFKKFGDIVRNLYVLDQLQLVNSVLSEYGFELKTKEGFNPKTTFVQKTLTPKKLKKIVDIYQGVFPKKFTQMNPEQYVKDFVFELNQVNASLDKCKEDYKTDFDPENEEIEKPVFDKVVSLKIKSKTKGDDIIKDGIERIVDLTDKFVDAAKPFIKE